ncbi:MAG: helix-turn-helix domain-containing protein [Halothiobacillus sp.]|nr:helix-turn-helix domain-containing protein [Halothiobacillus sp.]
MDKKPLDALLTVKDIARLLDTSVGAIRVRIHSRSKSLPPHLKIGRRLYWRRDDVVSWLDKQYRA